MFGLVRPPQPPLPLTLATPLNQQHGVGFNRAHVPRAAVGLGTASIGVVFIFNLDIRVDESAISDMITKACFGGSSADGTEALPIGTDALQQAFIQFRRVPQETFGIALFRAAAPAARAARALTGVTIFGKELFCQPDKRTHQLLEQWRYLRGKELGAKIASQGYEVPSNILELVNNELTEDVNKAKGLVVEQAAVHENRLTRFQGLDQIQILDKLEEDRIQDVLVRKAEEAGKIDKANSELRALVTQLREHERVAEGMDRELEKKESVSRTKRKYELKTKTISGCLSLLEVRDLVPKDRESLFRHPIDWDGLFNPARGGGRKSSVIRTLIPWLVRKVKDYLGSYDRELVEYVLRRVRLRADPLELTTDLRQYIDDDSDEFVKQLWFILVFETIRKQNTPSAVAQQGVDLKHFATFILNGIPPSVGDLGLHQNDMDLED